MPLGKDLNRRGRHAKASPAVPTVCLTLPDGMSLTSVVLESIGSNGRLLTGPAALPWRHREPRGASRGTRKPVVKPQHGGHLLARDEVREDGSQTRLSRDVNNAEQDLNSTTNIKLNLVSDVKHGFNEAGSSSKMGSYGGSFWDKMRRLSPTSGREPAGRLRRLSSSSGSEPTGRLSRTAAVLCAFRSRRGKFQRASRLTVPLAGLREQVRTHCVLILVRHVWG